MVRKWYLPLLCAVLAGCAGSPTPKTSTGEADLRSQAETQPQKRQAVQAEPLTEPERAQMQSARRAADSGNWEVAASVLEDLKTRRPDVSDIYATLGWVARQREDPEAAIAAYRKAFELDPYDAVSANNLALLLRERGRFREAVSLLQEGLRYSPNVADMHYNLAVIAELYLLDLELALTHYREFRELSGKEDLDGQEGQKIAGWIADLERRLN